MTPPQVVYHVYMDVFVVVASDDFALAKEVENRLASKGCRVLHMGLDKKIPDGTTYLVVIKTLTNPKDSFVKSVNETSPKLFVIERLGTGDRLSFDVSYSKILFDQLLPHPCESLFELSALCQKQDLYFAKDERIFVGTANKLMEELETRLFGFSQNSISVLGRAFYPEQIIGILSGTATAYVNINAKSRFIIPDGAVNIDEYINGDEISQSLLAAPIPVKPAPKKKRSVRIKIPKINVRRPRVRGERMKKLVHKVRYAYIYVVLLAIGLTLLPFALLVSSVGAVSVSVFFLDKGNLSGATTSMSVAQEASRIANNMLNTMERIPLVGPFSGYTAKGASLMAQGTKAASRVLALTSYAGGLSSDILNGNRDVNEISKDLHLELSALYNDLSFIQGETDLSTLPMANLLPNLNKIGKYRSYVLTASKLSEDLPSLLGYDRPKTYMLLLQNNMELRPTGGFIGSFALITFDKGKMIDNKVYDVYSADGQLKGYVKPPKPIEEYLGEASWSMRDSNWDPDFPTSAKRAEWFLDKTIDRQVDGVIGVNLEVIKKYLEVTGPVDLADFGDTINSDNLYEKVQYEVEGNFFPGSRKKAQYLSALSTAVINRLLQADSKTSAKLLAATVETLDSRDLEVYMHDASVNSVLSEQHWDGAVNTSYCSDPNCVYVFAGLVEANVGVNKANYFVKRKVWTKTNLTENGVSQQVILDLKDDAPNKDRVPEQRYKNYVRAIAPSGSVLDSVIVEDKDGKTQVPVDKEVLGDRTEYGALVDVNPTESARVTFSWTTPVNLDKTKPGVLKFSWWKQSGVGEYPFDAEFAIPGDASSMEPPLTLTKTHTLGYNTNLSEDKVFEIHWKATK